MTRAPVARDLMLPREDEVADNDAVRRAFEAEKRRAAGRLSDSWYFRGRYCQIRDHLMPGSVLDIGTAEGLFACQLAFEGWSVTALDVHAGFSDYVHTKARLNDLSLVCIQSDAVTLPIENTSFDNVILGEILQHQAAPRRVVLEAARVLRPGGRMVITTPIYPYFAVRSFAEWEKTANEVGVPPEDKSPDRHVFEFIPGELQGLIRGVGLELTHFGYVDTRLWETRARRAMDLMPWSGLFSAADATLLWLNRRLGVQNLPWRLRARQMIAVAARPLA